MFSTYRIQNSNILVRFGTISDSGLGYGILLIQVSSKGTAVKESCWGSETALWTCGLLEVFCFCAPGSLVKHCCIIYATPDDSPWHV